MKKQATIAMILCFALIAGQAHAFNTDPSKHTLTCLDNGALIIKSPNIIDYYNAYKVNVIAKKSGSTETFDVAGTWKAGNFESEENIFSEEGTYTIIIDMGEDGSMEKDVECPGFRFSCNLFSVKIARCYNEDSTFNAIFTTENEGKLAWDFTRNITYIASDDKGHSTEINPALDEISISKLEDNRYLFSWDTAKNIKLFHIKVPLCKSGASLICSEPQKCTESSECLEDEKCDTYCKKLDCLEGEFIRDHECVVSCRFNSECGDSLACTKDSCRNNICVHEKVTCTSGNECTTGTCTEPVGCTYTQDEECISQGTGQGQQAGSGNNSSSSATVGFLLIVIAGLALYILKNPRHTGKPVKSAKKKSR